MKMILIFPLLGVSLAITTLAEESPDAAKPGKQAAEDAAAAAAIVRLKETNLAKETAMQVIDATRSSHRLLLKTKEKQIEAAVQAQNALDEFQSLSMRLKNDNPGEWEGKIREIELYAYELHKATLARNSAKNLINAESVNARITPENLAAMELKVREIKLQIPGGEGEFFAAVRKRFELANAHDDAVERNSALQTECQEKGMKARRLYLKLPPTTQRVYDPEIEKIEERLALLGEEAESAKLAEMKGEANLLPENKRWPAAKKRFDEALAETVDLGN